jgi:hypothetical protein
MLVPLDGPRTILVLGPLGRLAERSDRLRKLVYQSSWVDVTVTVIRGSRLRRAGAWLQRLARHRRAPALPITGLLVTHTRAINSDELSSDLRLAAAPAKPVITIE